MKIELPVTCLILMISAGSFLAQIPNGGFENWTSMGTYDVPDNWKTMNFTTAYYAMYTASKGTPGNPGSAFLQLTSKTINGSVVPGIAVLGKLDTLTKKPVAGVPFTQRPASFGGKWQHMIFGTSQGSVMALLTKWNAAQNKRDTIAFGSQTLAGMAMSWANFSQALTYKDSLNYPDSCMIALNASGAFPANNDYLWVDNLAFSGNVAVVQPPIHVTINETFSDLTHITLFPNPSSGAVTIHYDLLTDQNVTLQAIDIGGKLVREIVGLQSSKGKNTVNINTTGLAKGNYTLLISTGNSNENKKLLVE